MRIPSPKAHGRLYGALVAALALTATALVLTLGGGGNGLQSLVVRDASPEPTALEPPTPPPSSAPTASSEPSVTAPPSPSPLRTTQSPEPASAPLATEARLLGDDWVDATFGDGRPITVRDHAIADDVAYGCTGHWVHQAGRDWLWPDETQLTESLQTMSSEAPAHATFTACRNALLDSRYDDDPMSSRRLDVGDEALLVTRTHPLVTSTYAVARVGTSIVVLGWLQSGEVPSDAPAERMLRAAAAGLVEQPVPDPVAAAPVRPVADLAGFLSTTDVGYLWSGDYRGSSDTLLCGPDQVDPTNPPRQTQLHLRQAAVSREWNGGPYEPEFGWSFTRARSTDTETAASDFQACRSQQAAAKDLPDVGDEAFCVPVDDFNPGAKCFARKGDTFYLWSDEQSAQNDGAARLLRLAITRDGGGG